MFLLGSFWSLKSPDSTLNESWSSHLSHLRQVQSIPFCVESLQRWAGDEYGDIYGYMKYVYIYIYGYMGLVWEICGNIIYIYGYMGLVWEICGNM